MVKNVTAEQHGAGGARQLLLDLFDEVMEVGSGLVDDRLSIGAEPGASHPIADMDPSSCERIRMPQEWAAQGQEWAANWA